MRAWSPPGLGELGDQRGTHDPAGHRPRERAHEGSAEGDTAAVRGLGEVAHERVGHLGEQAIIVGE